MKIDLDSKKFKKDLEKTKSFANKICSKMNLFPNPEEEVNLRTYIGLTKNQILHGKRYCPCFMVLGETMEEKESLENRVCPCSPALTKEIPLEGKCHCGIFCSSEYINNYKNEMKMKTDDFINLEIADLKTLLSKSEINGKELVKLIEARKNKKIDFLLVDVREESEYSSRKIVGVDHLVPTSDFYKKIKILENQKEGVLILQCHSGGRSFQAQQLMKGMGYQNVINLSGGISNYPGKVISSI